ncbi:MAG: DNA repair exonuclease [Candidatus Aenigmarchaeota archaeon]|nr:DNA repair exonuclease [Candidatus Aenigmarchaeota archaeon]
MRFAHMSDVHLGSWSAHPELKDKACEAFSKAADICISQKTDFIIIAGDFFDTSMPSIDVLKSALETTKKLHDGGISIYVVPGSHDFSPTGKTALSLLEAAGFVKNVANVDSDGNLVFTKINDVAISGMIGRKGSLEHDYFSRISCSIPECRYSIFVMHSAINEYKPEHLKDMAALPLSALPKGFDYYANGHVHKKFEGNIDGKPLIFPGPLFPTEFTEMAEYDSGFWIIDTEAKESKWNSVKLFDFELITIDGDNKEPHEIYEEMLKKIKSLSISGKLLLIKARGVLKNGRLPDIDFNSIAAIALEKGAFSVKKNFNKLTTKEYEEIKIDASTNVQSIEEKLIEEHCSQSKLDGFDTKEISIRLIESLSAEKQEDEANAVFENRLKESFSEILRLDKADKVPLKASFND